MKKSAAIIGPVGLLLALGACNVAPPQQAQQPAQQPVVQKPVCPNGLPFSDCNNSSALHGQLMMHNMTNKSYQVTVYSHEDGKGVETYHLMPQQGWTFTGLLQGQRMVVAKPVSGGEAYESHCMVVGGTQHIMNITHFGVTEVEKKAHM